MRRLYVGLLAGVTLFPIAAQAQETLAGVGAASGIAAGMGAMAATNIRPGEVTKGIGQPNLPGQEEMGGMGGPGRMGPGNVTNAAPAVAPPTRFMVDSGEKVLNELLSPRARARSASSSRLSRRQRRAEARRLARLSPAQRRRLSATARNWTSYYLPQDRYKVTSSVWRYVTIEDDAGDYPVRYYYRPSSAAMIDILRRKPRRGQPRANRVIGFRTWQDAMKAGYRPDPVSQPEPAGKIIYLARLARTPQLARYVEYVYGGQVTPESFDNSVRYTREVERIVRSRADTRPMLGDTMRQVYAAFVGEGSLPTSVGRQPEMPRTQGGFGGPGMPGGPGGMRGPGGPGGPGMPGMPGGGLPGGGDARTDNFNNFSNRAGNLANVPANNR